MGNSIKLLVTALVSHLLSFGQGDGFAVKAAREIEDVIKDGAAVRSLGPGDHKAIDLVKLSDGPADYQVTVVFTRLNGVTDSRQTANQDAATLPDLAAVNPSPIGQQAQQAQSGQAPDPTSGQAASWQSAPAQQDSQARQFAAFQQWQAQQSQQQPQGPQPQPAAEWSKPAPA